MSNFKFTSIFLLALVFIVSCSSNDNDNDSNPVEVSSSSIGTNSSSSLGQSSCSSLGIQSSSSSSNASSSSKQENNESSSSQNISNSSSSEIQISSSSSSVGISSSSIGISSSSTNECEILNTNMAVEMNLNEPVVVRKNSTVLVEGVNYEVISSDNSIKVQGLKDYIGSVKHTPSNPSGIVVKDGNKILLEDVDYSIVRSGSSVTIIGMNNYMGSVAVELPCEPPAIVPPTITTTTLPSATVGTAYSKTLTADGSTPITWNIQSGALPAGLSLSGVVISGTPTVSGTFSVTVRATNAGGYNEKTFIIMVGAVVPSNNTMYHGHIWTPNPTIEELSKVISGEWAYDDRGLTSSEVTREGKTITFRGAGVLCIMIPKAIGQIASLKNSLGSETLGSTFLFRGEITLNGIDYYLYTAPETGIDGLDLNIVMTFQ